MRFTVVAIRSATAGRGCGESLEGLRCDQVGDQLIWPAVKRPKGVDFGHVLHMVFKLVMFWHFGVSKSRLVCTF